MVKVVFLLDCIMNVGLNDKRPSFEFEITAPISIRRLAILTVVFSSVSRL